jgi:hypothetical protein
VAFSVNSKKQVISIANLSSVKEAGINISFYLFPLIGEYNETFSNY